LRNIRNMAYQLALDMIKNEKISFDNYLWIMFFLITAAERKHKHLDYKASLIIDQMFSTFYENAIDTALKIAGWNKDNLDIIKEHNIEPSIAAYPAYLKLYWQDLKVIRYLDIHIGGYAFKKIFFFCEKNIFTDEDRMVYTLLAAKKLLHIAENDIDIISEHYEEYRKAYYEIPSGQKLNANLL
jgi:hypothetical protein